VEPTEFGADSNFSGRMDVIATTSGFLLMGVGCRDCPPRIYTSETGKRWRLAAELDLADAGPISLATDGRRLVGALQSCDSGTCRTEIWSSVDGGPWARRASIEPMAEPLLAVAGTTFVVIGEGGPHLELMSTYFSADGAAWSELIPAFRSGPDARFTPPCRMEFLAGGPNDVIAGARDCGAWRAVLP
jgi:hypothetical protein